MGELNKEYEASLKSIETENVLDRMFYRPIGFRIACALRGTGITPNMITIISIFVGAATGFLFYPENIYYNICGVLFLMTANILDCVDGQLARLTGIKSEIGRILDGVAGDIWFLCIYLGLAFRLQNEFGTSLFFVAAVLSGLSHLVQANITDYYKTLHLYFISKEKGSEFPAMEEIEAKYNGMKPGVDKVFFYLYRWYSLLQIMVTPCLQRMLKAFHKSYGDDIPEDIRLEFREGSKQLMKKYIDWLTFNGRTVIMFVCVLSGFAWAYFIFEIVILNMILATALYKHEKMCASLLKKYEGNGC